MTKKFKPYYNDVKEEAFTPDEVPWINAPQINSNISIEN